jgi:uncharacterized membrane protein SpoIIM required for sporulation
MNQDSFTEKYKSQWEEFENWLNSQDNDLPKDKRPKASGSVDVPHMYRQLCHHLSLAQSRNYSAHLVEYLNQLTLRGHQYLYRAKSNTITGFINFVFYEFPSLIRKEWRLFWLANILFYGPLFAVGFAIQENPEFVYSILPPEQVSEYRSMYDPNAKHIGAERQSDDDFYMFGFYIYNNISVGFRTFAGGMLFGLGSIFFLVYNGLSIGAVAGHLIQIGYSETFLSFVIGHGSFELTAIIISGMAGLKLGGAMIRPGRNSRTEALKIAGRTSLKMVYGVILMLVIAAFLEAFWSSKGSIDPDIKFVVGYILWGFIGFYFLLLGRRRRAA